MPKTKKLHNIPTTHTLNPADIALIKVTLGSTFIKDQHKRLSLMNKIS